MLIAERYGTLEDIAPLRGPGFTLYAGIDRMAASDGPESLCTIKVYNGITTQGGKTWRYLNHAFRRESETLRRISRTASRFTPLLHYRDGGIEDNLAFGANQGPTLFSIWQSPRSSDRDPYVYRSFRDHMDAVYSAAGLHSTLDAEDLRHSLLRNASQALQGILALHAAGIVHQSITPDTLIFNERLRGTARTQLAHFDMASLFHTALSDAATRFVHPDDPYQPRPNVFHLGIEGQSKAWSDFFAIGMILYKYLVHFEVDQTGDETQSGDPGSSLPPWYTAPAAGGPVTYSPFRHRACIETFRTRVQDSDYSPDLKNIIRDLLSPDAPSPALARDIHYRLARILEDEAWSGSSRRAPYYIRLSTNVERTYLPVWARQCLPPESVAGSADQNLLSSLDYFQTRCEPSSELRYLVHERRFLILAGGADPLLLECVFGSTDTESDVLLCLKFSFRAEEIASRWAQLDFPSVPFGSDHSRRYVLLPGRQSRPTPQCGSWDKLAQMLEAQMGATGPTSPRSLVLAAALDTVEALDRENYSEGYAYSYWEELSNWQVGHKVYGTVWIVYADLRRDEERRTRLFSTVRGRLTFFKYFSNILTTMHQVNGLNISLLPADPEPAGPPTWMQPAGMLLAVEDDPPRIVLERHHEASAPPKKGVIYHQLNHQQFHAVRIQREVIADLRSQGRNWRLVDQLDAPASRRVSYLGRRQIDAFHRLDEHKKELLDKLLNYDPSFFVQGPPGTGKTQTILALLSLIYHYDPFARVLITSQGHDPLNSLMRRIDLELQGKGDGYFPGDRRPSMLRLFNRQRELRSAVESSMDDLGAPPDSEVLSQLKGDDLLRRYSFEQQTDEAVASAREQVLCNGDFSEDETKRLASILADPAIEQLLRYYRARHANIVLVSCIGAGNGRWRPYLENDFDWVIIEEAARAYLPELLVPMVQGSRWILVGDHKQLPPYNFSGLAIGWDRVLELKRRELIGGLAPDLFEYLKNVRDQIEALIRGLFPTHTGVWRNLIHAICSINDLLYEKSNHTTVLVRARGGPMLAFSKMREPALHHAFHRGDAGLYWPTAFDLPKRLIVTHLANVPLGLYRSLHDLQELEAHPDDIDRLLDPKHGVKAIATRLQTRVRPALSGKKYWRFKEFRKSDTYKGLFLGLPQRASQLEVALSGSLVRIRAEVEGEIGRAARSHQYFRYVFESERQFDTQDGAHPEKGRTPACATLRVQYRMHPAIRYAVSHLFYGDTPMQDAFGDGPPEERNRWLSGKDHPLGGQLDGVHLAWANVHGQMAPVKDTTTRYNSAEAEWISLRFLPALTDTLESRGVIKDFRVVVLSGYRGQVEYLDGRLENLPGVERIKDQLSALRRRHLRLAFETVDSFQGQEAEIVLVSMVATSRRHFWRDTPPDEGNPEDEGWTVTDKRIAEARNRLNVLLSRAERLLIIVGDAEALSETSTVTRRLLALLRGDEHSPFAAHYRVLDGAAEIELNELAAKADA